MLLRVYSVPKLDGIELVVAPRLSGRTPTSYEANHADPPQILRRSSPMICECDSRLAQRCRKWLAQLESCCCILVELAHRFVTAFATLVSASNSERFLSGCLR